MSKKPKWTEQQKRDFAEWAAHYETYSKWLEKKPRENPFYERAVRCIAKRKTIEYYRGFVEGISRCLSVFLDYFIDESKDRQLVEIAFKNFCALVRLSALQTVLQLCESGSPISGPMLETLRAEAAEQEESCDVADTEMAQCASECVPADKQLDFYLGFNDGFRQMAKFAIALVGSNIQAKLSTNQILQTVYAIQAGHCVELMIHNWPKHKVPCFK